jgi:hypothetical protein
MFRLAMSHLQAIWTYCFDQTVRVETCSYMKFIIIYIYSCDRLTFSLFCI